MIELAEPERRRRNPTSVVAAEQLRSRAAFVAPTIGVEMSRWGIQRFSISGFRGFDALVLHPAEHVLLVGEAGAGWRDLVVALTGALDPDSTRGQVDVWDFHNCETTGPS